MGAVSSFGSTALRLPNAGLENFFLRALLPGFLIIHSVSIYFLQVYFQIPWSINSRENLALIIYKIFPKMHCQLVSLFLKIDGRAPCIRTYGKLNLIFARNPVKWKTLLELVRKVREKGKNDKHNLLKCKKWYNRLIIAALDPTSSVLRACSNTLYKKVSRMM